MKNILASAAIAAVVCCTSVAPQSHAQGTLLAKGTLTGSRAGSYKDLSGLNNTLENGVPANLLGVWVPAWPIFLATPFSPSQIAAPRRQFQSPRR